MMYLVRVQLIAVGILLYHTVTVAAVRRHRYLFSAKAVAVSLYYVL